MRGERKAPADLLIVCADQVRDAFGNAVEFWEGSHVLASFLKSSFHQFVFVHILIQV